MKNKRNTSDRENRRNVSPLRCHYGELDKRSAEVGSKVLVVSSRYEHKYKGKTGTVINVRQVRLNRIIEVRFGSRVLDFTPLEVRVCPGE